MTTTKTSADIGKPDSVLRQKHLLIVGPLPPPIGGSPLTLKIMLEELAHYQDLQVTVINTSPLRSVNKKATGFNFEKVKRMFVILARNQNEIRHCDAVLVFANDLFAFILVPLLLVQARLYRKPFYLKPVGSGLDLFMESHGRVVKFIMLKVLQSMTGILSQTQYLTGWLRQRGCEGAFYLPGCRSYQPVDPTEHQHNEEFRLIYLAHVTRMKGPLILLDALRSIDQRGGLKVSCDFYGPIHDDIQKEFSTALKITPNARYRGIVEAGDSPQTIRAYDVLVLPTCYDTEGHPGVLIEAMHAGVPIISTQIRTLPELVTHGVNGLLVPVGDSPALADAIIQLAQDCELRQKMGEANFSKGYEFSSDVVVARMIRHIFPV